jgi:hypothetical protein
MLISGISGIGAFGNTKPEHELICFSIFLIAGKYWNAIEWCCFREQERDVRYAAKGMRNTEFQTVTTNGRSTSQRRSSDRVRRRSKVANPWSKPRVQRGTRSCVYQWRQDRYQKRRQRIFELEQVQCVEATIWSVSLQQDGAIVEEATTEERTRRVCAKGRAV